MIRKVFKKRSSGTGTSKIDTFLDKYKLPKSYFGINRRAVTRGIAVGLFWAFIPMPMQMLAVIATTPFLKFNVPIAISMVWISNPFTMPPMYYIEYITGNFILGQEGIVTIEPTVQWFKDNLQDIFIPLYAGAAFFSIIITGIIFYILNRLWVHSVKSEKEGKTEHRRQREENKHKHHKGKN
jgi:uncharacterized protein (DUF2062 family)